MSNKKVSFTEFCKSLGCSLKNPAWSWCGVSKNQERVVFTIWEDRLKNGQYVLWNDNSPYNDRHGAKEMKRVLDEALKSPMQTLGILCTATNPAVDPRKRRSFNREQLLVLSLERDFGRIVANAVEYVPASSALVEKNGFRLPHSTPIVYGESHSGLPDAIDDLDARPAGNANPSRTAAQMSTFLRDPKVRGYVLNRASGACEYCKSPGFLKPDGTRYLEAHHIINLANQGPDTPENVIALCADHHRKAHFGKDSRTLEKEFLKILSEMES
ncbi:MAG: HNH endonuclease signature motif containing protein [Parvibaculum sp.]|nr:HNH endonuclease signature motif containing protein [Parvibaculum sp.]